MSPIPSRRMRSLKPLMRTSSLKDSLTKMNHKLHKVEEKESIKNLNFNKVDHVKNK